MVSRPKHSVSFNGTILEISDPPLQAGQSMPFFTLTMNDFSDVESSKWAGRILMISSLPSIDTPTCAQQTRRFNQEACRLSQDVIVLIVSMDLPFAQSRWCGAEGCNRVITASDFKQRCFGRAFGTYVQELGLLSRAVFVVDKAGKLAYLEYVPELTHQPNYDAAISKVVQLIQYHNLAGS